MIERCFYLKSPSINPYYNMALEEYLFEHIPANSMIFFLWQNQNTVSIGRNQSAYKECHLQQMEIDHCYLARRKSGGGAVYEDMGNLNFSYIMYMDNFDIQKQAKTIVEALSSLGIQGYVNGRNDIEVNGFKVSGNAYLTEKEQCLHHGTLMLEVDMEKMAAYLNVSDKKIQAKGFDSIGARCQNLQEFKPSLTMKQLEKALLQAVANNYGPMYELPLPVNFSEGIERFRNYDYLYNTIDSYTVIVHDYFSFGELQMYVDLQNNFIKNVDIYTDAIDTQMAQTVKELFAGLYIDDVTFKNRLLTKIDTRLQNDMARIYFEIKRYTFK